MSGCWKDWNGLEEVTEVTAFWGEGIGRNSHTLKLQELGGLFGAFVSEEAADLEDTVDVPGIGPGASVLLFFLIRRRVT